jgi:hypothetical protein
VGAVLAAAAREEEEVARAAAWGVEAVEAGVRAAEAARTALLRDLFDYPLHTVPTVYPSGLARNRGAVRKIAQAVYDHRRFADLPVLADALEDAGCADAMILAHCRGPVPHVKGCWVVDLLLGKA